MIWGRDKSISNALENAAGRGLAPHPVISNALEIRPRPGPGRHPPARLPAPVAAPGPGEHPTPEHRRSGRRLSAFGLRDYLWRKF